MKYRKLLFIALLIGVSLLTATEGIYDTSVVSAHQDTKTGTATGFPTGSICKKSGTYRASNSKLELIIVMAEGEEFPPFSDGTKTIWYPRSSSTKNQ
jgi:hypothetical protein